MLSLTISQKSGILSAGIPEFNKNSDYLYLRGKIFYINKSVEAGLAKVPEHKKITVQYESFCENPVEIYDEICCKLNQNDFKVDQTYNSLEKFEITRESVTDVSILNAFKQFY